MGRVAAIDYGLKRIGLAVSDREKRIALPVGLVEGGKKALQNIIQALPMKEMELVIVGLPLLMNGKKGEMAEAVERFAQNFREAIEIPVLLWDERLSSKHADTALKELSMNRKERSGKIDMVAATLLLQSYLDQQK